MIGLFKMQFVRSGMVYCRLHRVSHITGRLTRLWGESRDSDFCHLC